MGNEKITVSTFSMGLPEDSELRESLTRKPPENTRQLMRRIKKYKLLEDCWMQSKGKAPIVNRSQQSGFQPKATKGFKDTRARVATGGGEHNV